MAGDGMPQAGGMADMLPGTGRAGAAFPGKSGIIARSATWRKGREGGARGKERGRDKKRDAPKDWIGAERVAAVPVGGTNMAGFRGTGRGTFFKSRKLCSKKNFL